MTSVWFVRTSRVNTKHSRLPSVIRRVWGRLYLPPERALFSIMNMYTDILYSKSNENCLKGTKTFVMIMI